MQDEIVTPTEALTFAGGVDRAATTIAAAIATSIRLVADEMAPAPLPAVA